MIASLSIAGALLDLSDQESGCTSVTLLTDGTDIWLVKRFGDIVVSSKADGIDGDDLLKGHEDG